MQTEYFRISSWPAAAAAATSTFAYKFNKMLVVYEDVLQHGKLDSSPKEMQSTGLIFVNKFQPISS